MIFWGKGRKAAPAVPRAHPVIADIAVALAA